MNNIYIMGLPRSGKSTRANELSGFLGIPIVKTDDVYYDIALSFGLEDWKIVDFPHPKYWNQYPNIQNAKFTFYQKELQKYIGKPVIVEGYALTNKEDRDIVDAILMKPHVDFYVPLTIDKWLWRIGQKLNAANAQEFHFLESQMNLPKDIFTLEEGMRIDFPETGYQKEDISIKKFEALKMKDNEFIDQKVIDLGGNSGMISSAFKDRKAKSVTVIDYNWQDLLIARGRNLRTILFDLNNLDKFTEHGDLMFCMSVFHYIGDKEKFIKRCAELTDVEFILETPVIQEKGIKVIYEQPPATSKPTQEYVEWLLSKYFFRWECVGQSPSYDGSYRLVYKAYKK